VDMINKSFGIEHALRARPQNHHINDYSSYTLLLAEDIDINREIVISLLEPTNLVIDCAQNGAEVVKMFSDDPTRYSMILMDMQMPEMDGLEAARLMRWTGWKPRDLSGHPDCRRRRISPSSP